MQNTSIYSILAVKRYIILDYFACSVTEAETHHFETRRLQLKPVNTSLRPASRLPIHFRTP